MIVILDTNFLMAPFLYKIDVLKEMRELIRGSIELETPSTAATELSKLSEGKGRWAPVTAAALKWLKKLAAEKRIKIIQTSINVDRWILLSAGAGAVVCTSDKALRKSLKIKGVKTITIRARKKLFYS